MKYILTTAIVLASSTAMAADMVYVPTPIPVADYSAPHWTWAGGYVGVHGGYGWGRQRDNQSEFFPETGPVDTDDDPEPGRPTRPKKPADRFNVDGFVGGIHTGYNWQNGSFVYGIEGDFDYANIKGDTDFDYYGFTGNLGLKSDWQASLRLRAGYAVDTWLIYATGGVAFAHAKMTASDVEGSVSDKNTHTGWTIGAGMEKAFTPNWIGRLEARYTDFGSKRYDLGDYFGDDIKSDWHQTTVNVGLSYKF